MLCPTAFIEIRLKVECMFVYPPARSISNSVFFRSIPQR
jgi:hypothetical protein